MDKRKPLYGIVKPKQLVLCAIRLSNRTELYILCRIDFYVCWQSEYPCAETSERGICRYSGRDAGGVKKMEKAIIQLPDWEHAVLNGKIRN